MSMSYLINVRFGSGQKPISFKVKAPNEALAKRQARQLLNKLGQRPTSLIVSPL